MKKSKENTGENKKPIQPGDHNRKRSNTLSALKRKNMILGKDIFTNTSKLDLNPEQSQHMKRLHKELNRCANLTLYRTDNIKDLQLIASFFCGCKLCYICNQQRQKATRRKYWKWFKDNEFIYEVENPKNKASKFVTNTQAFTKYSHWKVITKHAYSLMHLTLTVPHTDKEGFNGERYYFEAISDLYWLMRKNREWNNLVFGGEYGIETTAGANGLHIHIHSLLLVRNIENSRNRLHKFILTAWNKLSVNRYSVRGSLTPEIQSKILQSNKLLTLSDINKLNPHGATLFGLETIFSINQETGQKVRTTEWNSKQMLIAVMECISYHFSPQAFDKKTGEFDFILMAEIMPKIYRKALYKKFGCLHGESCLNVSFDDPEDIQDEYTELSQIADLQTGEIISEATFHICNPLYVFHIPENDFKPVISRMGKDRLINVDALTTREALQVMTGIMKQERPPKKSDPGKQPLIIDELSN